jgi:hypothetical protein
MSQTIEPQEITPEQIQKLVEKAISEGKDETRYLLKLQVWHRQGPSYEDEADFKVIYGEAEEVKVKEWDEGYPYRRGVDVIIIPKAVPTIVIWRHKWDYDLDRGESETVYVFTSDGWKKISVR